MIVELHPEELLDKESAGTLTTAERSALDAHAARCAACGCERRLRVEFGEVLGEGERASEGESESESESESERERESESESERNGASARWWGRYVVWVGVAAVLVTGAAAAGEEARRTANGVGSPVEREEHVRSVEPIRASAARGAPRARMAPVARVDARQRAAGPALMFEEANRARQRGEYARAVEAYRRLQQRYPTSREARVSYATMGRMQLDRSDAAGALATFALYEHDDPELDEVVMSGRALALEQLGSERVASRAWAMLLEAHPDSPYAAHARLRARAGGLAL